MERNNEALDVLLLARDDARRAALMEAIRGCGLVVRAVARLDEALASLTRARPRVMLLCMSAVSGQEMDRLGALRSRLGPGRLYAVLDEGGGEGLIRRCLGLGVDRCFAHPLDLAGLCETLRSAD